MKLILLSLLCAASAQAITIPVDLGQPRKMQGDIFVSTDALSGTLVQGQTLSLDYQFNNLLYLYNNTSSGFYVAIRAETNMMPFSGDYPSADATGYFVGVNGYQGPVTHVSGGGISNPHVTEILFGLAYPVPLFSGAHQELFLTGLHFDLTLPDMNGVEITGLKLHFDPNAAHPWNNHWAIRNHVPETGSTLCLLCLASLPLLVRRPKRLRH
jgi:hypothetical protein